MRLTDKQFVEQVLETNANPNDLIVSLEVVAKLLKKYGKIVYSKDFANSIKDISSEVYNLLFALKVSSKDDKNTIKNIIMLIKRMAKDYNPQFVVKTDSKTHNTQIQDFLNKKFEDWNVSLESNSEEGVSVSGEGRYYQRSLDQDVKKLLNIS